MVLLPWMSTVIGRGPKPFYGKEPHKLLWASLQAARGKITVSGISIRLNYCVIFKPSTQFTNMAAGRITQAGGPRVDTPGLGGRGRRSEQINRLI